MRSATIAKKKDMKNQGQMLSMGYGFVEMKTPEGAMAAMRKIQVRFLSLPFFFVLHVLRFWVFV